MIFTVFLFGTGIGYGNGPPTRSVVPSSRLNAVRTHVFENGSYSVYGKADSLSVDVDSVSITQRFSVSNSGSSPAIALFGSATEKNAWLFTPSDFTGTSVKLKAVDAVSRVQVITLKDGQNLTDVLQKDSKIDSSQKSWTVHLVKVSEDASKYVVEVRFSQSPQKILTMGDTLFFPFRTLFFIQSQPPPYVRITLRSGLGASFRVQVPIPNTSPVQFREIDTTIKHHMLKGRYDLDTMAESNPFSKPPKLKSLGFIYVNDYGKNKGILNDFYMDGWNSEPGVYRIYYMPKGDSVLKMGKNHGQVWIRGPPFDFDAPIEMDPKRKTSDTYAALRFFTENLNDTTAIFNLFNFVYISQINSTVVRNGVFDRAILSYNSGQETVLETGLSTHIESQMGLITSVNARGDTISIVSSLRDSVNDIVFYNLPYDRDTITSVIDPVLTDESILTIPNPASDFIEITGIGNHTLKGMVDNNINIYNTLGECILSVETQNFLSQQRINISHLPVGVYYIKIINNKGKAEYQKFIKL